MRYIVTNPKQTPVVDLSGEVDGVHYLHLVGADNRPLLIVNLDALKLVDRDPTPTEPPRPVTYAPYHTLRSLNLRVLPTTASPIVRTLDTYTNLSLSTEIVTPSLLIRLELPAITPIEDIYTWRAVESGGFVAVVIDEQATVKEGSYNNPPPTSGNPTPLIGKNLSLNTIGDFTFLAGGTGMGVNMRELAYWGTSVVPYMPASELGKYLGFLRDNGFLWVRLYAFHSSTSVANAIARTVRIADALRDFKLLGCVTFMDSLGDSGFTFPAYQAQRGTLPPYHREAMGHLHKSFYLEQAWKSPFQPAMEQLVTALKGHPGIGMWQVINEPAIYPQPSTAQDAGAMEHMLRTLSARIHAIDPGTPISGGFISTHHFAPTGADRRAYSSNFWKSQPNLHVATGHLYQDKANPSGEFAEEGYVVIDAQEAHKTRRAFALTEFGSSSNRVTAEERLLLKLSTEEHASFATRWAFDLGDTDRGIGDLEEGFMKWHGNDFEGLLSLFRRYMGVS